MGPRREAYCAGGEGGASANARIDRSFTSLSQQPFDLAPGHDPRTFPGYTLPTSFGEGRLHLLICSLLKPVVPVSIVRGVGPIVPDMMEPR